MGGKGETVSCTREFRKDMKALSAEEKKKLKDKINAIIDGASNSLTIIALVGDKPYSP
jgi:mRNA-degrading endonuclease RelE of RelBE toxin-antitoxin system